MVFGVCWRRSLNTSFSSSSPTPIERFKNDKKNLKMTKDSYKKTKIGDHDLKPETLLMSYGYDAKLSEGSVKPPVFLTSTFTFDTAEDGEEFFNVMSGRKDSENGNSSNLIYSRFNHPNAQIIEDRLAILEGSEAAAVMSSGMGAISSVLLSFLRPGDAMVKSSPLYGGTRSLISGMMADFGIGAHPFASDAGYETILETLRAAAKDGRVGLIFVETPANPTNMLVDFEALLKAVATFESETGYRPLTVCDNTLLGPVFQKAVPQGIDLAVYSLTKYVGGHSDLVAGAVCGSVALIKKVISTRSNVGLNLDPHTAWMISRSLETLTIRMERAADSGRKVAQWLLGNSYISAQVLHSDVIEDETYQAIYKRQCSGPGSTFAFVLDVEKSQAFQLINALRVFKSAVSLGGSESLVCHPASTTHSGTPKAMRDASGVTDGLIRLSIGLEHPDDLIADLDQAMKAVFS